jgi:hypothetical protein
VREALRSAAEACVSSHSSAPVEVLIDNGLSPLGAERLEADGHDAVHVRPYSLHVATPASSSAPRRVASGLSSRSATSALGHPDNAQVLPAREVTRRTPGRFVPASSTTGAAPDPGALHKHSELCLSEISGSGVLRTTGGSPADQRCSRYCLSLER